MKAYADCIQEIKHSSNATAMAKTQIGGEPALPFVDNRPEAIVQRKLQEMADNRPQAKQMITLQEMANNSQQSAHSAQLQAMANNPSTSRQQEVYENNTGLPGKLKTGMERLSGMSLDDVIVHRNSDKPAQLQAHAYAQGNEIFLAPGQEKHLPHETWHVVQQKQGRVKPTMQLKERVDINDDAALEKESDAMGERALRVNDDMTAMADSSLGEKSTVKGEKNFPQRSPSTVIQGYFTFNKQKTNDPGMFEEGLDVNGKRGFIWKYYLEPALKDKSISDKLIQEFKEKLLDFAMDDTIRSFTKVADNLITLEKERKESATPLSERESPPALDKLSSKTPTLETKEKHSKATYTRLINAENVPETFTSDDYTKGPAKRRGAEKSPTTPKGAEPQAWTAVGVKECINKWSCEVPLARHLAGYIWQFLKNTKEGKNWELKFREIDRLIDLRDKENQSRIITIIRKADSTNMGSYDRNTFTVKARQALKKALIAGTKHPADQQDVLFYDILLKSAVNNDWQDTAAKGFELNNGYKAVSEGGLSMIMTHWRPILFFDWILAEDVLNNAS